MKSGFVYSKAYDLKLSGLSLLHPFDGEKFSKAWARFAPAIADRLGTSWFEPVEPMSDELLGRFHTADYLESLERSTTIAEVIEIRLARFIPASVLRSRLLEPVRLACQGTLLATEVALRDHRLMMNFAGGYHHAHADHGEGFCFFADAALAIRIARERGLLTAGEGVLMIDLDAHRGNGFESSTTDDPAVAIFDMYNFQAYPGLHQGDPDDYPFMIPLKAGSGDGRYLDTLETELPRWLDANADARLVFYNAGNDILAQDPLGGLGVSYDGVVRRDRFVLEQLVARDFPVVIMTSGGYSRQSHGLIADMALTIHELTHSP